MCPFIPNHTSWEVVVWYFIPCISSLSNDIANKKVPPMHCISIVSYPYRWFSSGWFYLRMNYHVFNRMMVIERRHFGSIFPYQPLVVVYWMVRLSGVLWEILHWQRGNPFGMSGDSWEFRSVFSSVVGVLKSILQIFFGLFAFDRLVMNGKLILGITLSLIGGTMFSYFEYTNKQENKPTVDREDNQTWASIDEDSIYLSFLFRSTETSGDRQWISTFISLLLFFL